MRIETIYELNKKNQLIVDIPDVFKDRKKLLVILDDSVHKTTKKLNLLIKASTDPLFLQDIAEITEDFNIVDSETL